MPPAPPTFSTITCCPITPEMAGPRMRPRTSMPLPAPNGITMVTGRAGQVSALAGFVPIAPDASPRATMPAKQLCKCMASVRLLAKAFGRWSRYDQSVRPWQCYCSMKPYRIRYEETAMNEMERIERRISLHDMRVLMAVVDAGSMGKAAARLATSQPAISRSVSDLESALGVRLLDRGPHGIAPTPYGRALVKRGIAVFDELAQGVKDIRFLTDPTAGDLRIGASIAVAAGFVSAIIDRLTRRYPRLAFQVLAADTTTVFRALADREVDL